MLWLTTASVEQSRHPFAPSDQRSESWCVCMLPELLRIMDGGTASRVQRGRLYYDVRAGE